MLWIFFYHGALKELFIHSGTLILYMQNRSNYACSAWLLQWLWGSANMIQRPWLFRAWDSLRSEQSVPWLELTWKNEQERVFSFTLHRLIMSTDIIWKMINTNTNITLLNFVIKNKWELVMHPWTLCEKNP